MKYFKRFNDIDTNYIFTDKHIHSTWTDGHATISDIVREAERIGLRQVAIVDHIRFNSKYFNDYCRDIEEINRKSSIEVLIGFETKVKNFQGDIDVPRQAIDRAQIRIASVHRFPVAGGLRSPREFKKTICQKMELELSLAALKQPAFNILGHPGGMSLMAHKDFPLDFFEKIVIGCIDNNVAFEVNSSYHLPVFQKLKKLLKEYNVLVSFGSDTHKLEDMKNFVKTFNQLISNE